MKSQSKYHIKLKGVLLVACLLAATLSGCASSRITAAANMGATGKTSTLQAKNAILVTADEFNKTEVSIKFLYGQSTNTATRADVDKDIEKLAASYKELAQRAAVFDKLGETYTAFTALCAYDASTQFQTATEGAMTSVNLYATLIKKEVPFTDTAIKAGSFAGGLLASEIQLMQIKASSRRIVTILKAMHTLLSDKNVREEYVTAAKVFAAKRYAATQSLFEIGALDCSPLLNDLICDNYFTLKKDFKPVGLQKDMMQNGIRSALEFLSARKLASIDDSYNTCLDLLQQLITAHEEFNSGKTLNLAAINALAANLQQFVKILSESKTTS